MRFENDQIFATITAPRLGGGQLTIPTDLVGHWGVVLFYRGHW